MHEVYLDYDEKKRMNRGKDANGDGGDESPKALELWASMHVSSNSVGHTSGKPYHVVLHLTNSSFILFHGQPASATVLRPSDKPTLTNGNEPVVMTREVAREYFGIDMRSDTERLRDAMREIRHRLRVENELPRTPPQPSTTPPAAGDAAPTSEKNAMDQRRLALGVIIAMPNPCRPQYGPSSSSSSYLASPASESIRDGKMRAPDVVPPRKPSEEPELPDVTLGVIESDWTGKPSLVPDDAKKNKNEEPNASGGGFGERSRSLVGRFGRGGASRMAALNMEELRRADRLREVSLRMVA